MASGISILKGLAVIERRLDKELASVSRNLLLELQGGKTLTEAMHRNKAFFPELVITLTAAGEQSGELPQILAAVTNYYSRQKELKSTLLKALLYPAFLIVAALCVLFFFLLYVLPVLATAYTALQAKPNAFLQLMLQINGFLVQWYHLAAASVLLLFYTLYKLRGCVRILLLKISCFRTTYALLLEARFCKLLALLLNSGINITQAVAIAGATISDRAMLQKMLLFKSHLQRGVEISAAIEHSLGLFTPLTEELLTLGAATGYLPQMLEEAASIAETDLQERFDKVRELLTPALLLLASVLTAGIVCTVIGPLFDLFSAIPEY